MRAGRWRLRLGMKGGLKAGLGGLASENSRGDRMMFGGRR